METFKDGADNEEGVNIAILVDEVKKGFTDTIVAEAPQFGSEKLVKVEPTVKSAEMGYAIKGGCMRRACMIAGGDIVGPEGYQVVLIHIKGKGILVGQQGNTEGAGFH